MLFVLLILLANTISFFFLCIIELYTRVAATRNEWNLIMSVRSNGSKSRSRVGQALTLSIVHITITRCIIAQEFFI